MEFVDVQSDQGRFDGEWDDCFWLTVKAEVSNTGGEKEESIFRE